jgi:predicted O-methyltransferase YrrM
MTLAGPWMVAAAVARLDGLLQPDWELFEFGSGRSTAWFAARVGRVVSVEHDPAWHSQVVSLLEQARIANVDLRLVELDSFPAQMEGFPASSFDVVVVDGWDMEEPRARRVPCVEAAAPKVRPGGYLVLDDSERPAYAIVAQLLDGWEASRFSGIRDPAYPSGETALFRRPAGKRSP